MNRTLLVLFPLLVALVVLDELLADRSEAEQRAQSGVSLLVAESERDAGTIAAMSLVYGADGQEFLYGRSRGKWRCRQAFGALADEFAISAIYAGLLETRGVVRLEPNSARSGSVDPERAAAFGFGSAQTITVRFHGPALLDAPDRDVRFACELGYAAGGGCSFARPAGSNAVWEIDHDFSERLQRESTLPPLLDRRLLAGTFPQEIKGFKAIFIDWTDGRSLEIALEAGSDPALEGEGAYYVVAGDERHPAVRFRLAGYSAFLLRVPFEGIGDGRRRLELGLDRPLARVSLFPFEGEPIELICGAADAAAGGGMLVWNAWSGMLMRLRTDLAELLLPDPAAFRETEGANPWEEWLHF